jgi:hypothetical protein
VVFALVGPDQELWEYNPQLGPSNPVNLHWVQLTAASVFQMAAPGSTTTAPSVFYAAEYNSSSC